VKITTFEDIKAWQASRVLAKMVYEAVKSNRGSSNDYKFREQIHSAAVSIMSNIAEGQNQKTQRTQRTQETQRTGEEWSKGG